MFLRDQQSAGGATSQVDPDRAQTQRKRARKAARQDAREGIPGNPEQPAVPPFVEALIKECVSRVADARKQAVSQAEPHRFVIADRTKQIADAETNVLELEKFLGDAPRPTSSHSAKEAFRFEQNRLRIARSLEKIREVRDQARAELCGAEKAVNASFHKYWFLRLGEETHTWAVLEEHYLAVLLRYHSAKEALEKSLKPAIEVAFAEALRKLDEAEKFIFKGQQPFGPDPEE